VNPPIVCANGSEKSKPPPVEQLSISAVVGAGVERHGPIPVGAALGTLQLRMTYVPASEGSAATAMEVSTAATAHHAQHARSS
jgi:hypothetical protein